MSIQPGLERILHLLSLFEPLSIPVTHLAGTNGKGSVSTIIDSVLTSSGFRTGRFNSPHLIEQHDAIRICGKVVEKQVYDRMRLEVEDKNREGNVGASLFELMTMTTLLIFERWREENEHDGQEGSATARPGEADGDGQKKLDIVILECGMGGTSDATNVFPPDLTLLSVLTSVDLDHQAFLGNTVEEIARTKAGILRPDGVLVVGEQMHEGVRRVVEEIARKKGGHLVWALEGHEDRASATDRKDNPRSNTFSLRPFHPPPPRSISIPLPSSTSSSTSSRPITTQLHLPGHHQVQNLSLAVACLHTLRTQPHTLELIPTLETNITDESIKLGVESARWPGRCEWVVWSRQGEESSSSQCQGGGSDHFPLLLDGAHNPASATLLRTYIDSLSLNCTDQASSSSTVTSVSTAQTSSLQPSSSPPSSPSSMSTTFIISLSHSPPKTPLETLTPLLRPGDRVAAVCFSTPVAGMPWVKAVPADEVRDVARGLVGESGEVWQEGEDLRSALRWCAGGGSGLVVVCGSLYLVGEVYSLIGGSV